MYLHYIDVSTYIVCTYICTTNPQSLNNNVVLTTNLIYIQGSSIDLLLLIFIKHLIIIIITVYIHIYVVYPNFVYDRLWLEGTEKGQQPTHVAYMNNV